MPGSKYHDYFEEHSFYHVYNRSVGKEACFGGARNYQFFLRKFSSKISPFANTYAYCLMPTHFHFLIEPKNGVSNELLEAQFKALLSSYSRAFNIENDRHGSLFQKSFKRIKVSSDSYLKLLVHYIHHNPIHHGYVSDFTEWRFSSYNAILSDSPSMICRKEVLELFNDRSGFVRFHADNKEYRRIGEFLFET